MYALIYDFDDGMEKKYQEILARAQQSNDRKVKEYLHRLWQQGFLQKDGYFRRDIEILTSAQRHFAFVFRRLSALLDEQ